jgi:hypothetical protein
MRHVFTAPAHVLEQQSAGRPSVLDLRQVIGDAFVADSRDAYRSLASPKTEDCHESCRARNILG